MASPRRSGSNGKPQPSEDTFYPEDTMDDRSLNCGGPVSKQTVHGVGTKAPTQTKAGPQAYTTQQYTAQCLKELNSIPGRNADFRVHHSKPIPIPGPRRGERSELGASAPRATSPKPAIPERTDSPELIFQMELGGEEGRVNKGRLQGNGWELQRPVGTTTGTQVSVYGFTPFI
ncbi:hypothetical protein DL767_002666 [Monosporascus sp. MG133]|nr:hypothetical protein DL767_002666 [Monosporascus sp. MG133]